GSALRGRVDERMELTQRDRALLGGPEIKRMIFAHSRVAFSLASLARGAPIKLLDTLIESVNLFGACELCTCGRGPRTLVPSRKNQMRPCLILRPRHSEQLHARVWMIACG